eukprot:SAG31_NODE_1763_length_7322_cov_21.697633_8_plen_117_part_00
MGQIVPAGAEGSVFALVSSLQTVGSSLSGAISAVLTDAFGVTLENYAALPMLTLCTSLTKLIALPFVPFVPASIHHAKMDTGRNKCGAICLAITLFGGITTAIGTAVFRLAGGSFT